MANTPKKKATPDMRKSVALTQPKPMKGVAMTGSDIKKSFALNCPSCGNDKFVKSGDENLESEITCPRCGTVFIAGGRANDQARQEAQILAHELVASAFSDIFKSR